MAFLIPENIPTRDELSPTLQAVARCLRDDLAEQTTVWLDQDAAEPYLTVLDPSAGVLLLYAPSLSPRDLKGGLLGRKTVKAETPAAVLERARSLSRLFEAESRLPLTIPAVAAIALPNATRSSLAKIEIDTDAVLTDEDFAEGALEGAVRRLFRADGRPPLGEKQELVVRGIVNPRIVISGLTEDDGADGQLVFRPPDVAPEDVIRVLDREQERLAHHLGEGYRVIRGVAGSGKTLVLTFRAKWYAEHFPNRRVLLTCFNVPLSKALAHALRDAASVSVRTVDGLAWDVCREHGIRINSREADDWTRQREEAVRLLRRSGGEYDVVLVDEAQDLDVPGLDLAHAALRKGRSDFVVALDGAQNVYRKKAKWNPPDQTARGRTTVLRRNYRNTKEILEFASRFLRASASDFDEALLDDPTIIIPAEATSRRGPEPRVVLCRDARDEVGQILDEVERLHEEGVPWENMAILYGSAKPWQSTLYFTAQDRKIPYFWVSRNPKSKREVMEAGDVVRVATFQGLKGLEFSRVFMCGVNDIYDPGGSDDDTIRKIVYVAMTRAMDELMITVSGGGVIGTELQAALR
jgi:hypothetical protein